MVTGPGYAVEDLDESTCRRLLSTAPAGRIGFTARALPRVLPVYCRTRGDEIVVAGLLGTSIPGSAWACFRVAGTRRHVRVPVAYPLSGRPRVILRRREGVGVLGGFPGCVHPSG